MSRQCRARYDVAERTAIFRQTRARVTDDAIVASVIGVSGIASTATHDMHVPDAPNRQHASQMVASSRQHPYVRPSANADAATLRVASFVQHPVGRNTDHRNCVPVDAYARLMHRYDAEVAAKDSIEKLYRAATAELESAAARVRFQESQIVGLRKELSKAREFKAHYDKVRAGSVTSTTSRVPYSSLRADLRQSKLQGFVDELQRYVVGKNPAGYFSVCEESCAQLFKDATVSLFPHKRCELTMQQDLYLLKACNMRFGNRRRMGDILSTFGFPILLSFHSLKQKNKEYIAAVSEMYCLKQKPLEHKGDGFRKDNPVVLAKNVKRMLTDELNMSEIFCPPEFNNMLWVALLIDGGGSNKKHGASTKLCFAIMNTLHANSPSELVVFGSYYGDESYANLDAAFREILLECHSISHVNWKGVTMQVMWTLIADYKLLNTISGLSTCSSTYPCLQCEYRKGTIPDSKVAPQTLAKLSECNIRYKSLIGGGKPAAEAMKSSMGVIHPSLHSVQLHDIVPSLLHILIGIGGKLMSLFEGCVMTIDMHNAGCCETIKYIEKRSALLVAVQQEFKAASLQYDTEWHKLVAISIVTSALRNKQSVLSRSGSKCACAHCVCSYATGKGKLKLSTAFDSSTCCGCKKKFHAACVGVFSGEEMQKEFGPDFFCFTCSGESKDTFLSRLERRMENQQLAVMEKMDIVALAAKKNKSDDRSDQWKGPQLFHISGTFVINWCKSKRIFSIVYWR